MQLPQNFRKEITRLWWIPLATGICCVALGVWCIADPVDSIAVLAYTFSIILVCAGVLDLSYAVANIHRVPNWGWSLALGLIELLIGCWLFSLPAEVLATAFMFALGVWLIIVSINSICESLVMAQYFRGSGSLAMILILIASVVLALIFLTHPVTGGIAVWIWIGLSLITFGIYRIVLAFRVRHLASDAADEF